MTTAPHATHYRPDIDGLRAVAVLSVVVFHGRPTLLSGGFVGVDVFFVISGYLITGIILKELEIRHFSVLEFYARRVRRIFPALSIVLVATWALGWLMLEPEAYRNLGKHIIGGAAFVDNILLWTENGYFDSTTHKPLLHLWSLAIEEQFYLVWPVLLMGASRFKRGFSWLIPCALIASLCVSVWRVRSDPAGTFYLPLGRFWELLVGAGTSYLAFRHPRTMARCRAATAFRIGRAAIRIRDCAGVVGLGIVIGAAERLNEHSIFPGYNALLPVIGAALVIGLGEGGWVNRSLLSARVPVGIGLISYPLYLWHWPLLFFGRIAFFDHHWAWVAATMIGLSIALGIVTLWIERPLRFGVLAQRGWIAGALSAMMCLIAGLGVVTYSARGWSERFPRSFQPLLDFSYDYKASLREDACLLVGSEHKFAPECAGDHGATNPSPPLLIWGDSHGAMLYRALLELGRERGLPVAQFTTASCPPILGFEKKYRPPCRSNNDLAFQEIVRLRPTTVVMAHDWPQSVAENSLAGLASTVEALRSAGVVHIVLLGPVPHWTAPLHSLISRLARQPGATQPPQRLRTGLDPSIPGLDRELASLAAKIGIGYVSPFSYFCNRDGCMATLPSGGLTAFDEAHLTRSAATLLVRDNAASFFFKR